MLTKLSLAHIAFAPVALLIVEVFGQDGASYQSVFTIHARQTDIKLNTSNDSHFKP